MGQAARTLKERGGTLVLLHPQPAVARLLTLTGAEQIFAIRGQIPGEPESEDGAGLAPAGRRLPGSADRRPVLRLREPRQGKAPRPPAVLRPSRMSLAASTGTTAIARKADTGRCRSVPPGAFAARHADGHGHRPWKHLDLRKRASAPALRLVQRRIIEVGALPCRGRNDSAAVSLQAPLRAGTYDLPGPSQNAWPNSFQASFGNTVSSPVIVKLVAPPASLTGQTGTVLAIFAVAALQAYVLAAATIERIARKLLPAGGFVIKAAAFACLWLAPRPTTTLLPFLPLFGATYFFSEFGPNTTMFTCPADPPVSRSPLWSPRMPGQGIITAGVSRTGSAPRLTPPLRGQPFQAGRGVFACLGLAPEQLGCLGQPSADTTAAAHVARRPACNGEGRLRASFATARRARSAYSSSRTDRHTESVMPTISSTTGRSPLGTFSSSSAITATPAFLGHRGRSWQQHSAPVSSQPPTAPTSPPE
jgi:hypothetical protein